MNIEIVSATKELIPVELTVKELKEKIYCSVEKAMTAYAAFVPYYWGEKVSSLEEALYLELPCVEVWIWERKGEFPLVVEVKLS